MKKGVFLAIVILLVASSLAGAWEFSMKGDWGWKYQLETGYSSRHVWKGYDIFHSNRGALNTSADIKFGSSGFGANILWTRPIKSGYEDWEWFVFEPYYEEYDCWDDFWYEMDYRLGWRYYYFPDGPLNHSSCHWRNLDFQEFYGRFAWPRLFPYGVVPYYEAARIWPSVGGRYYDGCCKSYWRNYGGWFHTFGIYRDWEVDWGWWDDEWDPWYCDWWYEENGPGPLGMPRLTLRSSFEMTYNDGAGPTVDSSKNGADHDWSYSLFKLETNVQLKNNIQIFAGLNYQISMDQSVNNDDEFWFNSGMRINF